MTAVHLDHVAVALGERRATVEQSAAEGRLTSSAEALRRAGFREHSMAAPETTALDLARRAVAPVAAQIGDVGSIVWSSCIPQDGNMGDASRFDETGDVKHLMQFPACRLQAELGLQRASVIGLTQQACTGVLGAIRVARALLVAEPDVGRVLCVTADRFPPKALREQGYALLSDGAAACVVSRDAGAFEVLACHAITNGGLASASDDETVGMFFPYCHRLVTETLARARMTVGDLRWVVAQNVNRAAWQVLASALGLDPARVAMPTLEEAGHVVSADVLLNLATLHEAGEIAPGDRLLLVSAGFGMNVQATLLERTRQ
jgi:3-oxoacyl-[acyl-carrier-protein] synthase-3